MPTIEECGHIWIATSDYGWQCELCGAVGQFAPGSGYQDMECTIEVIREKAQADKLTKGGDDADD